MSHQNQGRVKPEPVLSDDVIDLTGDDDFTGDGDTVLQQSIAALTEEVEPIESPAVSLHEETSLHVTPEIPVKKGQPSNIPAVSLHEETSLHVTPESTVKKEQPSNIPAIVIKPESTVSQDVHTDTIDGPSTSSLRVLPTRHSTFRPNYTESSDGEVTETESEESVHKRPRTTMKRKVGYLIYFIYLN